MKQLIICLFILSGCSSLPQTMRGNNFVEIPLTATTQQPTNYLNTNLRWGGTIINVSNKENGSRIYALYYPLVHSGRPETSNQSEGRFAINSTEFLDPAIYNEGAEFTVTGLFSGHIEQKIDQKTISIPLLKLKDIHVWPVRQQNEEYFYPYPHYPIYHPFYRYRYGYYYDYY